jgi:hypothetical protein
VLDLDEYMTAVIMAFADQVAMALLRRPSSEREAYLETVRRRALKSALASGFDAAEATRIADTLDKLARVIARYGEIGHEVAGHA